MRKAINCLLFVLFCQLVSAQQTTVKGIVRDTLENKNLRNAVISLLQKKDSTLYQFSRSDAGGGFHFNNVAPGNYVLLVTFPKFADFVDEINVKEGVNDLGSIPLTLKARLLDAVVIKSAGAIRIKGDTTEFVADSFKLKEGATVEELLKRLPGFQVNSKGEITTQGQKVQKVLVDGEEFFGDDPTMATQNISAKAVDKVQVYDTKTDRQQITGISTGTEGKTVNIKLKEDAKKGAFGKAHFGTNFSDIIDAKALFNKFKGTKKISVYGTKSDVSTGSLNWEDRQKLGIENDFEYDEIGGYYYSFGSNDEFNDWSLKGLPNSYTAGALYSNKWNDGKNNLNTSYRYNRLGTINSASTLTQNVLSNLITYRNKFQETKGLNQQHSFNGKYEWKLDSLASLKFTTVLNRKTTSLFSNGYSEFLDNAKARINTSNQIINNETERLQTDNQLTYKQLFMKKNRMLMATVRFGMTEDKQDAIIQTNTQFYKNNAVDSIDIADQEKKVDGMSKTFGAKITYNEPLTLKWNAVLDYSFNKNNSYSHRHTFNKDINGKYENPDPIYSNNFELDALSNTGVATLRYVTQKLRMSFAAGVSNVKLNLFNVDSNKHSSYNFLNFTPQVSIGYTFKPQTSINFNYRGTTRQPTIDQLQPIRENTDRLNIFIGNPDLKVGFTHSFNVGFNTYKTLSQFGIFANVGVNIPVNAIAFMNSIDVTRGKQTYTPVNVNGNRSWNFFSDFFKEGGDKKFNFGVYINGSGGRNINFVNAQKNVTNYFNTQFELYVRYSDEKKGNFSVGPAFGYNGSKSSLFQTYNANYWNYGARIGGALILPAKMELRSDCYLNLRQHLEAFATSPNQVNWNASLSKQVFKGNSGKIYLVVNDILDQNIGFNRNISSNFISEERYSKVSRYFLIKFEWTFNKMPGQK